MIAPQPKPRTRILDRIAAKREREAKALAFRLAVLTRDQHHCRACGRRVRRTVEAVPERAEVHHVLTRGAHPDKRFDLDNGLLVCLICHGRLQRHEMTL